MSVPGNAVQQLGLVPFDTEALGNSGKFTWGWGQWFLAVYNAIKYLVSIAPVISSGMPVNPVTPVGWLTGIDPKTGATVYTQFFQ